jgi:hypothetical protein
MPTRYNITAADELFVGDKKDLIFPVVDDAGDVVPITGWALEWVIRRNAGGVALLSKTVGLGIAITDGTGGIATVTLTAANTTTLGAGRYWYILARTDAGSEAVLAYGDIALLAR